MAVGGSALLWWAPTWGAVRHGYEMLLGTTLGLMALAAWAASRGPLAELSLAVDAPAIRVTSAGVLVTATATFLAVAVLVLRHPGVARALGSLGTAAGIATLVALAQVRGAAAGAGPTWRGVAELLAGTYFLGAVWNGMVLGHWYLVERRLSNRYMVWMAWVNVGAVGAGLASVLLSATNPVPCAGLEGRALALCRLRYSPLLSVGSVTVMMGAGLIVVIALIAAFNVKLAREGGRSIQASTGMFYLAVILAPAAEFAAKVRFF